MPKKNPLNSGKPVAFGLAQRYGNPERIQWGHWKRATTHSASGTQAAGYAQSGINTAGEIWESFYRGKKESVLFAARSSFLHQIDKRRVENSARTSASAKKLSDDTMKRRTVPFLLKQKTMGSLRIEVNWGISPLVKGVAPEYILLSTTKTAIGTTIPLIIWKKCVSVVIRLSTGARETCLPPQCVLRLEKTTSTSTETRYSERTEDFNVSPRYSLTRWEIIGQSIAYGMGPKKLWVDLNAENFPISLPDAAKLYYKYCDTYVTGVKYLRNCGKEAAKSGLAVNSNGRRRYWLRPNPDDREKFPYGKNDQKYLGVLGAIEREAGNFPIQSTNADIAKYAMILIRKYIKEHKVRSQVVLQVYDEIVTRTHKNDSEEFHAAKTRIMIEAAQRWVYTVPVEVDGHVLPYWTK